MKKIGLFFPILLSMISALAQQHPAMRHVCLSPPMPPHFLPVQNEEEPSGGRASGYAVPFDTIRYNNTLHTRALDIVICLDGVTNNNQIDVCDRYIDSLLERLQAVAHYQPRFAYFNIYRIALLSNEAGAAWGFTGETTVDNRYGSRFNAFTLPRLLIPEKYDTLFADIEQFVPQYDLALMMVYDKKYGGAGWNLFDGRKVATFSLEEESGWHLGDEIIIHEMQHIMPFAGHGYLGDEYEDSVACLIYDSIPYAPNFTADTINERKWQHCIGLPGVGFYPDAGICENNYRPTDDCIMHRVFGFPAFCPVCRENSTAWLDSMINPIYNVSPNATDFTSGTYNYSVQVQEPTVNTYRYQWWLDNALVAQNALSHSVDFSVIDKSQNHTLRFVCTDVDPFIIDTDLRRPWVAEWELLTYDSTVAVQQITDEGIQLFPNPAADKISVTLDRSIASFAVSVITPTGQVCRKADFESVKSFDINLAGLPRGIYFILIKTGSQTLTKKFAVE